MHTPRILPKKLHNQDSRDIGLTSKLFIRFIAQIASRESLMSVFEGLILRCLSTENLSQSFAITQVTNRLAMFVRNTADLETNYVSVERIHEYSQTKSEVNPSFFKFED